MCVATAPVASTRAFIRYAFAVQYHGGNLLGFSYQGRQGENCIVRDEQRRVRVDLRGVESVEGRIRRALDRLVGVGNYDNIRVSSRTDRGVHAWRNTFQVDVRPRSGAGRARPNTGRVEAATDQRPIPWRPKNLVNGLNFYLTRLPNYPLADEAGADCTNDDSDPQNGDESHRNASKPTNLYNSLLDNSICILSSAVVPSTTIPNENYDPSLPENESNPKNLPWDVRFTATRRTYAYQILHSYDIPENDPGDIAPHTTVCYQSQPFEYDRVWRMHENDRSKKSLRKSLDTNAMNLAGQHLVGTHDFTSFRGKGCQRSSPVVTLDGLWVGQERYHGNDAGGILNAVRRGKPRGGKNGMKDGEPSPTQFAPPVPHDSETLNLVTVVVTGKSFVYRQVRNMVACLVDVGRGKLKPDDVKKILAKRDRSSCASGMAPAKGLFLVDVEHGDFRF